MFLIRPFFLMKWCFPHVCWRFSKKEPVVYITFDDGPIPEVTPQVLDILDEKHVKATFFCVGENVKKYPDVYATIIKRGHRVGNHSFNHVQAFKLSCEAYLKNVEQARKYIKSTLFRPAHGQLTKRLELALKNKYTVVMWDVLAGDYKLNYNAQQITNHVLSKCRNGSIVVLHDSLKSKDMMLEALPVMIDALRAKGFEFRAIEYEYKI